MMHHQERRAKAIGRVPLETLVEICGNGSNEPAFEAESVDVSGRGMHVKTAYLPELGAPLVCRFEHKRGTVIAEGVVAWRQEHAKGGDFGIKFTALDSAGVGVLRALSGENPAPAVADAPPPEDEPLGPGSRVRLHIEGLGSPMKARVREKSSRKVHVASNLDFLKLGRKMQVEDLEKTSRHGARIESLNVIVDPQTGVPQLVVALKFEDAEKTPEPSVVDVRPTKDARSSDAARPHKEVRAQSADAVRPKAGAPAKRQVSKGPSDVDDDVMAEVARMKQGLDQKAVAMLSRSAAAARFTGAVLARYGIRAKSTTMGWMRGAGRTVDKIRPRADTKPLRKTAPPPGGGVTLGARGLRPQRSSEAPKTDVRSRPSPRGAMSRRGTVTVALGGFGVAALIGMVTVWGGGTQGSSVQKAPVAPSTPAGPVPSAGPAPAAAPVEAAVAAAAPAVPAPARTKQGIVAEVPLFGPVPMATMEPVPSPPPGEGTTIGSHEEAAEMAAAEAAANETWKDGAVAPENVKPWGRGPIHMPTVHRLKLDGPGSAIRGTPQDGGFAVLIPDRKAQDSGMVIAQSDRRIAGVKVHNTPAGARISFRFRDAVPGYRVRLTGEYAEFLISAPK